MFTYTNIQLFSRSESIAGSNSANFLRYVFFVNVFFNNVDFTTKSKDAGQIFYSSNLEKP